MYHMIICDWCNGRGFDIVIEGGSMFQYTCEHCKGAGRRIVFPPSDIVKIKGLTDWDEQQAEDKADEEKEDH
jgi:DnaJ-class molecular chaperone